MYQSKKKIQLSSNIDTLNPNQTRLVKSKAGMFSLGGSKNKFINKQQEIKDPTKFFISCKESRIESKTSFYGCFYLGPFDESLSQTLANDLRRTLLSELKGLAITSVEIEGVFHKFSNITGMKESVLDLICNFQTIILKKAMTNLTTNPTHSKSLVSSNSNGVKFAPTDLNIGSQQIGTKKTYTGFLKVRGPRVIKAGDLKLPTGIQCVDPNQYIATLAEDGVLNIKFNINEGKNYQLQRPALLDGNTLKKRNILLYKTKKATKKQQKLNNNFNLKTQPSGYQGGTALVNSEAIPLDAVFMPVTKVNCIVEANNLATDLDQSGNPRNQASSLTENVSMNTIKTRDRSKPFNNSLFFKNAFILTQLNDMKKLNHFYLLLSQNNVKITPDKTYFNFENALKARRDAIGFSENSFGKPYFSPAVNTDIVANFRNKLKVGITSKKSNQISLFMWHKTLFGLQANKTEYRLPRIAKRLISSQRSLYRSASSALSLNLVGQQYYKLRTFLPFLNLPGGPSTGLSFYNKATNPVSLGSNPKLKDGSGFPEVGSTRLQKGASASVIPKPLGDGSKMGLSSRELLRTVSLTNLNKLSYLDYLNAEYSNIIKLKPISKKTHLVLEIWTNGSIHPRQALYESLEFLSNTFLKLKNVKILGSMFKSELAYANFNEYYTNNKTSPASLIGKAYNGVGDKKSNAANNLQQKPRHSQISKTSLNAPIGVLSISLRAYTALRKAQIFTIGELINCSKNDLLKFNNIGIKTLSEIENSLINIGFSLS